MSIIIVPHKNNYCKRPIFKYDKNEGFARNYKSEIFDLTNIKEAQNELERIAGRMWKIQEKKEFSSEDKKIKFDNLLDSIKSKDIKQCAADFDILTDSVDDFSKNSLEKLYAGQLKNTKGFKGVKSVIDTYNASIANKGVEAQKAFSDAVSQSNSRLGQYLANLKGAPASMRGYLGALGKDLISGIGNAFFNVGITALASYGISKLISIIDDAYVSEEEAAKAFQENVEKIKEKSEKYKEATKNIQDYIVTYKELGNKTKLTAEEKQQLVDIQEQLIDTYGSEAKGIDLINGKYDEQIQKLKKLSAKQAQDWYNQQNISRKIASANYNNNKSNKIFNKEVVALINKNDNEETSNVINQIKDALGQVSNGIDWAYKNSDLQYLDYALGDIEIASVNSIEKVKILNETINKLRENTDEAAHSNEVYQAVMSRLSALLGTYQEEAQEYSTALKDEATAAITAYTNPSNINYDNVTADTYKAWSEGLVKEFAKDDPELRQAIYDKLNELFDDSYRLQTMTPSDLEYYWRSRLEGNTKIPTEFNLSNYTGQIDEITEKVDNLKSVIDKIDDGSFSNSDKFSLIKDFPDLLPYINDTDLLREKLVELNKSAPESLVQELTLLKSRLTDKEQISACQNLINMLKALGQTSKDIAQNQFTMSDVTEKFEDNVDEVIDKLEDEKDVLEQQKDVLEQQKEELEEIISQYEQVDNIVTDTIDKQITAIEDRYNAEIDKLKEANDERQDGVDLQEKLNNLENAKRKKVVVYSESQGWTVQQNAEEIKKAQQEYDNAVTDNKISELENQRDSEISAWEDYKEQWQNAVDGVTEADNQILASKILGSDWQEKIAEKDTTVLNNFNNEYKTYKNKLNGNINSEIDSIERAISTKDNQITEWNDYKDELSKWVKDISDTNSEYLDNLIDTTLTEKSTWEQRVAFMNQIKDAYKQASDFNSDSSDLDTSRYVVQRGSKSIGVYTDYSEAEKARTKAINEEFKKWYKTVGNADGKRIASQEKIFQELFKIKEYATGGVNDYTGTAMLHGSTRKSEVIFNSADAKKLYEMVHNTRSVANVVGKSIGDKVAEGTKNASVIYGSSSTNSGDTSIEFRIGNINTTDGTTFLQQMNGYLTRANLDRMVGKNR